MKIYRKFPKSLCRRRTRLGLILLLRRIVGGGRGITLQECVLFCIFFFCRSYIILYIVLLHATAKCLGGDRSGPRVFQTFETYVPTTI